MAMLFWRLFLITFGMVFGAILGLDIVSHFRWSDSFLILIPGAALLGGTFGWASSVLMPKAVEWLSVWLPYHPPTPTPRNLLRLGWSLGIAEGVVVGAFHGGILAAILGGYFGMILGQCTAGLSWYVRRQIPLVLLALSLGFLIEVGGCLLIAWYVQFLALQPFMMWVFSGLLVLVFLLRLFQYRIFKPAQPQ